MILSNDGLVAFHCRSYGTFFLQQKRLHNSYSGFTHYKNYRVKKATANPLLFLEIRDYCPRLFLTPFVTRFLDFYQQSYTLSGSLLPYRFVVNSLLYDSYPMGGASTSTSLIPQLVQVVIPPQHDASAGLKRFGKSFEY